jgi:serine/threonine protein kinase
LQCRWTAPEAVLKHKYSTQSEVYGFGITLFELLLEGQRPFGSMNFNDILKAVTEEPAQNFNDPEHIMDFVRGARDEVFGAGVGRSGGSASKLAGALCELALRCCQSRPASRPKFSQICGELETLQDEWLHSPDASSSSSTDSAAENSSQVSDASSTDGDLSS